MNIILSSRRRHYLARLSVFLITAALIAGLAGCDGCGCNTPPSQNLEIRTWYDLDEVRNNLAGNHKLINDLDSTTLGYEELASPTANGGQGWQPIGWGYWASAVPWPWIRLVGEVFKGSFDGQGHEIRDIFINRSGWGGTGLFGCVGKGGIIRNIGVTNATITVPENVVRSLAAPIDAAGILMGFNMGSVSDSYVSGAVSCDYNVGGLVGLNIGTVTNCYSTANVTGSNRGTGGLVGMNGEFTYDGSVRNCYSTGSVTGYEHVGGLVGMNEDSGAGRNFRGTVRNSFWDVETSGQATSDGGTGKTRGEMKDIITFLDADWEIITVAGSDTRNAEYIWNIVNGVTYPFLSWQP
jgi:hypothetical protein